MGEICILGAEGRLGSALARRLGKRAEPFSKKRWNILNISQTRHWLQKLKPEVVFNGSAYVLVDAAEENPTEAFAVNALGPHSLAQGCQKVGALLVHFSTDYVFSGSKRSPYTEKDRPDPCNLYGLSKWVGETAVLSAGGLVIRTSGLFGKPLHSQKKDFVQRILEKARRGEPLAVVSDQVCSPTYALDLARATLQAIQKKKRGLLHMANSGHCSWWQLAQAILKREKLQVPLTPILSSALKQPARRPPFSALRSVELPTLRISLPSWQDALKRYLATLSDTE